MKSRAFASVRHAAVAACIGGAVSLALPVQAADSQLSRPLPSRLDFKAGSALKRGPVGMPSYGARIPVGAPAYVRPFRGFLLPRIWIAPTYYISNWQGYGLARPAQGYGWSRYYDDAVLTDRNGRVYDSVQGVNWQAAQAGQAVVSQTYSPDYDPYNYDGDLLLGNDQVVHGTHWTRTAEDTAPGVDYDPDDMAPPPPVAQYDRDYDPAFLEACRRDSGLGGAAIGAAAGGLAGNRIAGRGNRTGGTLIGAGVGAVAGMVLDKAEDRERCKRLLAREAQGGYGVNYGQPPIAPPPAFAGDYDPAFLEACRRDSGLGGAAIGAAVGGLAGNRVAGRGNRTGGTLIGAGVGAVAGIVIDKAEDRERCRRLLAQQGAGYPPAPGQGGYPPPPPGYYYYYPPPIVTTVTITPAACNCTEEVVVTETVPVRHRPRVYRSKNVKVHAK
ncbi:RcnB family protein [Blastomonas fulva]|uniref:RcnB family protein n=1 Tax=Blastomonas fulva TaxID=1550728 RepID=UPI0025A394AE|nr:RcnB family protein [Blastomonas fulva]MDM7930141.1 RcnB family protein [Blastomonas fulva]MDM7965979.1 RcnB family protein [Blastomonas fulva]